MSVPAGQREMERDDLLNKIQMFLSSCVKSAKPVLITTARLTDGNESGGAEDERESVVVGKKIETVILTDLKKTHSLYCLYIFLFYFIFIMFRPLVYVCSRSVKSIKHVLSPVIL